MELWLVEDGEKRGPFQTYEVRDRIERGELRGDELAWHKDRNDWVELKALDVFRAEFEEPEPEPPAPLPIPPAPPQPLLRFWARWFDVFLYITLVFVVLWVTGQDVIEAILSPVFRNLWFIPYLILEALALHLYKTTPGKHLLGLRVETADGGALTLGGALMRSLRVFIFGMGVFFWPFFLPVICHAFCCWYTVKKGEAPWDAIARTKVRSAGIDLYPTLVFVLLFMTLLIVLSLLVLPGLFSHQEAYNSATSAG